MYLYKPSVEEKKKKTKAKQKNLSTLPPYGSTAELFGPGYTSPAVLGWWNTKQRYHFLKSKFRDESGRLLAPRKIETVGEKFVEGTDRVSALFLTVKVFVRDHGTDDYALKKDVLSIRLFSDHLRSAGTGISQGFGGTAVLAHFLMYL